MQSKSPAGFKRELQNFTVMAWEYYGYKRKGGGPDAEFVIYILRLKVQTAFTAITLCLQFCIII